MKSQCLYLVVSSRIHFPVLRPCSRSGRRTGKWEHTTQDTNIALSRFLLNSIIRSFHVYITMPKKKMAHSSLNASWFALFRLNYRKSVTIRKIFKSSLKLYLAEYCEFFCLQMTTKWSWLLCFCQSKSFNHKNFPRFSMYQWKY